MRTILWAAVMLMALTACKNSVKETAEIIDLPRVETPDSVAKAMEGFFQAAANDSTDIHSVMIVKDGSVIYSHWQSEGVDSVPHVLHSVSKTFTATAVGLAIADGKMALTDKVIDYFPDQLPAEVSENLKAMTVRDLLTMSCGHDVEPSFRGAPDQDWVTTFLAHPVEHEPGTFYLYNSLGTYMLSAIVQQVTGQKVVDYLSPRLFEPLHIDKPRWEESPQGINCGGWGLYLKTEDLAKMGQLLLQKGEWNDEQKKSNREKSHTRCLIEHIFGFVERAMNGSFIRSIGIVRAKASTALTCLVYNIFRYDQLCRCQPAIVEKALASVQEKLCPNVSNRQKNMSMSG